MGKHKWKRVLVEHDRDGILLTPFPFDISLEHWSRRSANASMSNYVLSRHNRWWPKAYVRQSWAEHPSCRAIGLVIRREIDGWSPALREKAVEWATRVGVEELFDRSKFGYEMGPSKSLKDSMEEHVRELLDRDALKMRRQEFNAFLNGTSLYDLSARQLEELSVAVDWHLNRRRPGA